MIAWVGLVSRDPMVILFRQTAIAVTLLLSVREVTISMAPIFYRRQTPFEWNHPFASVWGTILYCLHGYNVHYGKPGAANRYIGS